MSREGIFLIYCIEIYKAEKNLNGYETMQLFKKYDVLSYIRDYYEALHTTGERYLINDIDLFIKSKQNA